MYYPFDSNLTASFLLFLDSWLGQNAANYVCCTGQFFYQQDSKYGGSPYSIYSSTDPQFIADGATLSGINQSPISGVYINNVFSGKGSGVGQLKIDFLNGRVFIPGANQTNLNVSGVGFYSKEINTYIGTTQEAQLFLERAFKGEQNLFYPETGLTPPRQYIAPCLILTPLNTDTIPFALGGSRIRQYRFTITLLTSTDYEIYAARGAIVDCVEKWVPIINQSDIPYTYFNDIKNPSGYNYNTLSNLYFSNNGYKAYIKSIKMSNMSLYRGKLINFQQFYYNTADVLLEVYNYQTPAGN